MPRKTLPPATAGPFRSRHLPWQRDVYRIRLMTALVLILGLTLVCLHLPLHAPPPLLYWGPASLPSERVPLSALKDQPPEGPEGSPQATAFGRRPQPAVDETVHEAEPAAGALPETTRTRQQHRLSGLKVRDFAETMPEIVGGLRQYYLQIDYPQEARTAGIEGRLVLSFVVQTDGRATDIHILQSLHPLCDSAAVRALREVRFTPGRHDGVKTRVRMHLPVRFELVAPGEKTKSIIPPTHPRPDTGRAQ